MVKKLLFSFLILGWLLFVGQMLYSWFAPITWWIESATLEVDTSDKKPMIKFKVNYRDQLLIHWNRILITNITPADDWTEICAVEGEGVVYPGIKEINIPIENFIPCAKDLKPGRYVIEVDFEWSGVETRNIVIESNIFTIQDPKTLSSQHATRIAPIAQPPEVQMHSRSYRKRNQTTVLDWLKNIFNNH